MGVEVDLIIQTHTKAISIEIKSSSRADRKMFKHMHKLAELTGINFTNYVVYRGEHPQSFEELGKAAPYQHFLANIIPALD